MWSTRCSWNDAVGIILQRTLRSSHYAVGMHARAGVLCSTLIPGKKGSGRTQDEFCGAQYVRETLWLVAVYRCSVKHSTLMKL